MRGTDYRAAKTAGDHFNPTHKKHGLEAVEGAHAGDTPNLHIPPMGTPNLHILANGDLSVEILNTTITLAEVYFTACPKCGCMSVHGRCRLYSQL
jgi:Cu/Zn superoxide dismutase